MRTSGLLGLALVGALAAGCSSYTSHVQADETALGSVVVYRNGIAYYERNAVVRDGKLTMTVPNDKVDDFLKSLTVKDAETGAPLPVSFPTSGASATGEVDMTVQVAQPGSHDVVLTYITESPAWKPSYRVIVDGDDVKLQGWAVVDNTSGETWREVKVGVGSSSALSFRYDLRTVQNVHRETLATANRFAVAPPTGSSTRRPGQQDERLIAAFTPEAIPAAEDLAMAEMTTEVEPIIPDAVTARGGGFPRSGRDDVSQSRQHSRQAHAPSAPSRASGMSKDEIRKLAEQLNSKSGTVVIEGYARPDERDEKLRSSDRANWLRNELIAEGVAPARLKVEAKGNVAGQTAGVRLIQSTAASDPAATEGGDPVGEAHFMSENPLTVQRGTSAMISILDEGADGSIVYLYDPESERGNSQFAFKSIRFKNPTESMLEAGPMTVYGDERFIGEGLTDSIPARATAVVPFALDRQVIVERQSDTEDQISRLMTLQRGILRTEVQHTRRTILKIDSVHHKDTEVFVRHTVRKGWKLTQSPEVYERVGESHLFRVPVPAGGKTVRVVISETTPLVKTLDIRSRTSMELVRLYLDEREVDERFKGPMARLLGMYTEMSNIRMEMSATRERLAEFRARSEELEGQIVSLDGVRSATPLLRHLQRKLADMADRVQQGTIDVVNLQEKLMLERIRFQDSISEFSYDEQVSDTSPAVDPDAAKTRS